MGGFVLLGLLTTGAVVSLLLDFFNDDGASDQPEGPGTGGPGATDSGTEGDDLLQGTMDNDTLDGLAGDDTIIGGTGDDIISGGQGDDRAIGDGGSDIILGNEGDDTLIGRGEKDLLIGGAGEDVLYGGTGADILFGVNVAPDALSGADLAEGLVQLPETDTDAGDQLFGGYGADLFLVGSADTATGENGTDTFIVGDWISDGNAATITDYEAGVDTITVAYRGDAADNLVTLGTNDAGDALIQMNGEVIARVVGAGATLTLADISIVDADPTDFNGTGGDDVLRGRGTDDILRGFGGDDLIEGGAGSDLIVGADGVDTLAGGAGGDTLFGGDGSDVILGMGGYDFIRGGRGDDIITDNQGQDTIYGELGDDLIISSGFFDEGDLLDVARAGGTNADLSAFIAAVDLDNVVDTDPGDEVYGGYGDDTLIFGRADTVTGGFGADTFVAGDWLEGTSNAVITDFNVDEDVLLYSVAAGVTPTATITYSEGATETTGNATIWIGEAGSAENIVVIRDVGTNFTLANIQLSQRT